MIKVNFVAINGQKIKFEPNDYFIDLGGMRVENIVEEVFFFGDISKIKILYSFNKS